MSPGPRVGLPSAADLVCEKSSAIEVANDGVCEDETVCMMSGSAATDVGFATPADSVTTGCTTRGVVDDGDDGDPITTVPVVSELVGAIFAGGSVGAAATCEGTTTGSQDREGSLEAESLGAGADGSRNAGRGVVASDIRTRLPVPAAEDTVACDVGKDTRTDCPTGEDDTGGGGDGGCFAIVEVVGSVGATAVGAAAGVEMEVDVAAVRARERVHLLPFTVVIDSCGEAMQAAQS